MGKGRVCSGCQRPLGAFSDIQGPGAFIVDEARDRLARGHCGRWLRMLHVKPGCCKGAGGSGGGDNEVATCPPSFPVPNTRNTRAPALRNTETKNLHWYFGHLVSIQWLLSRSCMFGFTHTTSSPVRRDGVVFSIQGGNGWGKGQRGRGHFDR